jgi:hypothetical protein
MTKCSRIARGFGCGSGTGFAAEERPKAGFGLRASAAFTVLKPIGCGNVITDDQRPAIDLPVTFAKSAKSGGLFLGS